MKDKESRDNRLQLIKAIWRLIELAEATGDTADASNHLEEMKTSFSQMKKQRGNSDNQTLTAMGFLGDALRKQGDYLAAEKLLQDCYDLRKSSSPDHWATYSSQSLLGSLQMAKQKFDVAKINLVEGYRGLKTKVSSDSRHLTKALNRLIELAETTDNVEDLEKWQAEMKSLEDNSS